MPKKLIGLTQGLNVPSRRFRWEQYIEHFQKAEFDVYESIGYFGAYPPIQRPLRAPWLAMNLLQNITRILKSNKYDLIFLQRNLISSLYTVEPLIKKPFVFDVDDAIFLGSRGANANKIAGNASITVCGNNFLGDHFSKYSDVVIVPTAVDTERFKPSFQKSSVGKIIGWSGSSSGLKYVYSIEAALVRVLQKYEDVILKIVSDAPPAFKTIPSHKILFEPWSSRSEAAVLNTFDIGIMPLTDDLWARGKCSYKMLTYMACGVPVVVSPVGMNADILKQGECGLSPTTIDEWIDALSMLLDSSSLCSRYGDVGRQLVESTYSKDVIAPKLVEVLKKFS